MDDERLRILGFNPNWFIDSNKRSMCREQSIKGKVNVLELSQTNLFGQGVAEGENKSVCSVWECLKGRAV